MEDPLFEALGYTRDAAKDLISLASGIIAVSITFVTSILGEPTRKVVRRLVLTWIVYFVSILFGILTLLAVIGNTADAARAKGLSSEEAAKKGLRTLSPYESNVRLVFYLQLVSFLAGTAGLLLVGAQAAVSRKSSKAGATPDAASE
jgi:hypothetical protein